MNRYLRIIALILLITSSCNIYSKVFSKARKDTFVQKFIEVNNKVYNFMSKAPAPIIKYTTETNWVFGLAKWQAFNLNKKDSISNPSRVNGTGGFSLGHQAFLALGTELYFGSNKNIVNIDFRVEKFPRDFFGTGNEIYEQSIKVTSSYVYINLDYKRKIFNSFYTGLNFNINDHYQIDYEYKIFPNPNEIVGSTGGLISGLGFSFLFDTRDNIYNSSEGLFINLKNTFHLDIIGSDFYFNRYAFDFRFFKSIFKNHHVFAYQFYTQTNDGTVPFYALAFMGGTDRMRGYYNGQYRDKTIIDSQLEYRFPLFWLLSGVVFAGSGIVSEDYTSMNSKNLKYTTGVGIRLMVDQKHRTNLRFDVGFGKETFAMFFGFSEAF